LIHPAVLCAVMGAATTVGLLADDAPAAPVPATDQQLMDKVKQLEQRVAELEGKSTQAVTSASIPSKTMDFLGQTEISGFASASYLYNFAGKDAVGRSFDANHNAFTFDKFKL